VRRGDADALAAAPGAAMVARAEPSQPSRWQMRSQSSTQAMFARS
jgi:hypothetical protein